VRGNEDLTKFFVFFCNPATGNPSRDQPWRSSMRPGDLVSTAPGLGYSWWVGKIFLCLGREDNWAKLLSQNGEIINSNVKLFKVISEAR
jgi:hypothetical protein